MSLPRSAAMSIWLNACLAGTIGPDDFAAAVTGADPAHLVTDWPHRPASLPLTSLPQLVRELEGATVQLAVPAPGDPLGLAGPADFNADAVEAGEAVVITGRRASYGLVPEIDARTVLWRVRPAHPVPLLDPAEASRTLRQTLLEATAELVRLDVARWQPEIPDLLLNLRHRHELRLPTGTTAAAVDSLERAALCLEIVDLARADDGGAISGFEISARAHCLTELDRAARRALVGFCSASLSAS